MGRFWVKSTLFYVLGVSPVVLGNTNRGPRGTGEEGEEVVGRGQGSQERHDTSVTYEDGVPEPTRKSDFTRRGTEDASTEEMVEVQDLRRMEPWYKFCHEGCESQVCVGRVKLKKVSQMVEDSMVGERKTVNK